MAVEVTSTARLPGEEVRRSAAALRLVAGVAIVVVSPLVEDATVDDQVRFGVFVAVVWLPLAMVAGVATRRRRGFAVDLVNLALDLGLLVAVAQLLDAGPVIVVTGHLLVVAYCAYIGGWRLAVCAALAGVALVADPNDGVDEFGLTLYPLGLLAIAGLVLAAARERSNASDRVLRLNEKSEAILSGIAEAVVVTTPRGRILEWNPAAERTFALPAADARGQDCGAALGLRLDVRDLDCRNGCALLGPCRDSGGDVEVWRESLTGPRQPLLATAVPVLSSGGAVTEVVHSYRDITRLKQADEAKTLFLATASHELKTPLTVIRGFSQMLLLPDVELTEPERLAALRAIDVRAGQLTGIVDRLLMSSRIEAGRIDLTLEGLVVGGLLRERVGSLCVATGRELVLSLPDELPPVWVDADAFTTVVDHLLDNAVKYSPAGGPITIAASALPEEVRFSFTDAGVGMTEEQAAHCFDRFWQAEPTDVRRFGGTGIGLYIVRSLVEGMGGRVSVQSRAGQGTTFEVDLLRADRVAVPKDGDSAAATDPTRGQRSIIREYMRQLGVPVESG